MSRPATRRVLGSLRKAFVGVAPRGRAEAARPYEHDLTAAVLSTVGALVVVLDQEGRITHFNRACERLTGYGFGEVEGERVWDFLLLPEERAAVQAVFGRLRAGQFPNEHENHWVGKDGRRHLIRWSNTALLDGAGGVSHVIGTGLDVTEQRQAEEALRASEETFRALFEQAVDGLALADPQTQQVSLPNAALCRMLGYTPEEIEGLTIADLHPREELPRLQETFALQARGEQHAPVELFVRRKDGTVFPAEVNAKPVVVGGQPRVLGTFRDVTERKRAEEALRNSEARLRALFAGMTDLILVMDREGRYLEIVPTHPDLLYRPADELLGRTVGEVFPKDQADFFVAHIREALARGRPLPMEYDLQIGERELHFAATVSPLGSDRVIVVARDMTDQVEQYRRLVALERARADLAEHMNTEINHRARNNLAMVSGLLYMQAVQAGESPVAAALREAVVRIRTFVNLHERVYAAGAEEVDLLAALEQMVSTLRSVFSAVEADFAVTGDSYPCPTRDATNLVVAANELLMNALKHGHVEAQERLQVQVHLVRLEGRLSLSVWNSGYPVAADFEPRGHPGMGLRLVLDLAEQYGGGFTLLPEEGGTRATLAVPETAICV